MDMLIVQAQGNGHLSISFISILNAYSNFLTLLCIKLGTGLVSLEGFYNRSYMSQDMYVIMYVLTFGGGFVFNVSL